MILAHGAAAAGWPEATTALALVASALAYALGARRLLGRGAPRFGVGAVVAFALALAVLAAALLGPLDHRAGELFSAHMVQHLLLVLAAAPLLVLARPGRVVTALLPRPARRALARTAARPAGRGAVRAATNPFVVAALAAVGLWGWHLPALYDAAVRADAVHLLEHATLLLTAAAFWDLVAGERHRLSRPAVVLLVFVTGLQSGALGAVLVFAAEPLYLVHGTGPAALADQQLAGVLMWVPSGFLYLGVMVGLLYLWLAEIERRHPDEVAVGVEGR